MKTLKLTELYCTVCEYYDTILFAEVQRFSNNNFRPKFTDEECITVYLFGIAEGKLEVKAIYRFIKDYWQDWFPDLPSYQKFNKRINQLAPAFRLLCELLMNEKRDEPGLRDHVLDSMPIIVASAKRSGSAKAATGLCNKGYCSSKGIYYYGVKLHAFGQRQRGSLPTMRLMKISPASQNDISVAKEWLRDNVWNLDIYADKMYANKSWAKELEEQGVNIFTPVKLKKGQKALKYFDTLFSSMVSAARQSIESFFNWIQQKTGIQSASKVRSDNGLLSFIFARLASLAFFYW